MRCDLAGSVDFSEPCFLSLCRDRDQWSFLRLCIGDIDMWPVSRYLIVTALPFSDERKAWCCLWQGEYWTTLCRYVVSGMLRTWLCCFQLALSHLLAKDLVSLNPHPSIASESSGWLPVTLMAAGCFAASNCSVKRVSCHSLDDGAWSCCSAHHDFSNLRILPSCIHDCSPPSQLPRTYIQKYRVHGVALPSLIQRSQCFQQGPHTSQSFPDSWQQNCMKLPQLYLPGTLCSGELL